jgi:hypothetical protein
MQDHEYEVLKVKAAICPSRDEWPSPDSSKISISGDRPTLGAPLYSFALHDCVDDARDRTLKTFGRMAAIEEDKNLSPTGKAEKKKEIAEAAIADHTKSKALEKARTSVANQVKRWDEKLAIPSGDSAMNAEIRKHISQLKPEARMAFINANAAEVGSAVITAPAFLSGLSHAELGVVRHLIETTRNPEIAKAKADTMQALADAEQGWRAAIRLISERGGLTASTNGQ